ncbi:MAG: porin [Comamonadaceae bacterium]|nr:MAG: porin [Comamonadaceae bacterium]
MKKTLIALAALGAMAGVAHAQSTVTLYGLVDANVGSIKTNVLSGGAVRSQTQTGVNDGATGGLQGSRWGMRVSEDLGGGLAAVANIESGFAVDTGASAQGGLLFGRRANVGLSGGFGTVTLGRQSTAYTDVAANHAMMGATLFDPSNTNNAVSPAVLGTLGTSASLLNRNTTWIGYTERVNNSVKYVSPVFGGFSAGVFYGFGEDKTPTTDATKTVSASIKYANGPLLVSAGYQDEGYARTATNEPKLKNALLNVAYDFGVAKVGFGFNRAKYEGFTVAAAPGLGLAASGIDAQKEYSFSVAVPLGATTISAGVAQSKGDTLGKSTGYGIQALYSLSKRTTLYTGVLSTKVYERLASITASNLAGSDIGRHQQVSVGVRHTF